MPSQLRAVTTQYVVCTTIIYHFLRFAGSGLIFSLWILLNLRKNCIKKGQFIQESFSSFLPLFLPNFPGESASPNKIKPFCNKLNSMPSQLRAVTIQYVIFTTIISLSSLYSQWGYIFPKDVIHGLFHNFV